MGLHIATSAILSKDEDIMGDMAPPQRGKIICETIATMV